VLKEGGINSIKVGVAGSERLFSAGRLRPLTTITVQHPTAFQLAANMGTSVEIIDDFYGTKWMVIRRWLLRLRSDLAAED
jgi:hypothetical protein